MSVRPVILILGPTAGGKTHLAIDLAQRLPGGGECIGCDSMQIYRGMDIGTAKPTLEERAQVPHHLIDIADPRDDSFSVERWLELAGQAIDAIRARGKWPIIVGGTNLYVQAFLHGLLKGPEPNEALRQQLNELDPITLRHRLEQADPGAAQRIHPRDRKRSIRAIEVFEVTGQRLSEMQTQWSPGPGTCRLADLFLVGLDYPVETINRRINARVKAMIEAGFVDEVKRLHAAQMLGRNARAALGYQQIIEHLDGKIALEEAIEQIKIRTRRYAKQQRTWLRRFRHRPDWRAIWIDAAESSPQEIAEQALAAIKSAS